MREVKYIFEDEDIIVCHKPAGMATEGARVGSMDVVSSVRNYLARKNRAAANAKRKAAPYVATVSRLDQPVEGVLVLAKTKAAATSLSKQIKEKTTDKYYYALCYGNISEDEGHLKNNLARRENDGNAIVLSDEEAASLKDFSVALESGEKLSIMGLGIKNAELDYKVIARSEIGGQPVSLLEIKLLTGRYHQIRAQLSHFGFPILGDQKYGSRESVMFSEEKGIRDVCLVCHKFAFDHPKTGKRTDFDITPYNQSITGLLEKNA